MFRLKTKVGRHLILGRFHGNLPAMGLVSSRLSSTWEPRLLMKTVCHWSSLSRPAVSRPIVRIWHINKTLRKFSALCCRYNTEQCKCNENIYCYAYKQSFTPELINTFSPHLKFALSKSTSPLLVVALTFVLFEFLICHQFLSRKWQKLDTVKSQCNSNSQKIKGTSWALS